MLHVGICNVLDVDAVTHCNVVVLHDEKTFAFLLLLSYKTYLKRN